MADNDSRTEGDRFSPSVPPRSEPYALKGSGGPSILRELSDESQRYGIPVLAVTAVGKELTRDARYLRLATRICAAHGPARAALRGNHRVRGALLADLSTTTCAMNGSARR
jgi:hypothetical protein